MKPNRRILIGLARIAVIAAASAIFIGCGNSGAPTGTTETASSAPSNGVKTAAGKISIDGSTTVYPIAQAFAEDFHKKNDGVVLDVGKSGTGSGMTKFERGEIDIAAASRPIEQKEVDACKAANVEFIEVPIAADGVCVLVNSANTFADKMTIDELKKAFVKGSTVKTWADIHAGWPAEPIKFYGPTSNHGTYDYFTETVCGKKGNLRDDAVLNQEYTALITAIAGDKNALGYVGYAYYQEKKDQAKAVAIDAGKGAVAPSLDTIKDNSYSPLSRPLFLYVSKKSLERQEVKDFLKFALGEGKPLITEADYVLLPDEAYEIAQKLVDAGTTGSKFMTPQPGKSTLDIMKG
jgi:phosphate transport system substrate-binding protein